MDFGFSEHQEAFREAVRDFVRRECPLDLARSAYDDSANVSQRTWEKASPLGWNGLFAPELMGGVGLGIIEAVILFEEHGAHAVPTPYFSSIGLALSALLTSDPNNPLAAALIAGDKRATLALADESGCWTRGGEGVSATPVGDGYELTGAKFFVTDAVGADFILAVAESGDGPVLVCVDPSAKGLRFEAMQVYDATRPLAVVHFDGVFVDAAGLLGQSSVERERIDELMDRAKVFLAAELCGAASKAIDLSVEYVTVREQFGRTIGSFQAVQHRLADMKVDLENARSLVYHAAVCMDGAGEVSPRLAAAMAKAHAGQVCPQIIEEAIQVHGGVGFTWEHDLHILLKRAKSAEVLFGGPREQRALVAELQGWQSRA